MMRTLFLRLCYLVPIGMLAANALAWLRYGTDFPFYDDWRAYATGDIESLSPSRLFQVVNNTMSPVGFALDALAQRWLDGNTVAYQLLSMLIVLGGLLWLQWKLLEWAVASPLVRAVAFAFTVFMLQASTYWGEQNLAYHQALPLVFLLTALYAVLVSKLRPLVLGFAVAILALLAGLSYISGAVAALVMGGTLLLRARLGGGDDALKARAWRGGMVLAVMGALTTAFQFYATRLVGGSDRSEAFPVRWPFHPDFWAYMLGKVGRSFGTAFQDAGWELAFAAALAGALVAVFLVFLKRVVARNDVAIDRLSYVFLPVAGAVLVYLGLVSFGRAGFRDASIQSLADVFLFAYQRFHFFWLTLLFPWAVAALLLMLRSKRQAASSGQVHRLDAIAACVVLVLGGGLAGVRGVFDVGTYYEQGMHARAATIRCMSQQLGRGGPIMCPEFALPGWTDWTPAYLHARQIGASFTKYFPLVEHEAPRQWLFEGTPGVQAGVSWSDAQVVDGDWRRGETDPQLRIEGADAGPYARCRVLDVRVRLQSDKPSVAQVFYRPPGAERFSEALSVIRPVAASVGAPAELRFALESKQGFAPSLRIDPVQGGTRFLVEDVRIACSLQVP
ncbi:hypothetical protein [Ottowia thiooxydans]|uniref:hypothetical protein n=1 Tax=Ottowia thiooxydans TaxID=219182 RepID=UPI0004153325|nr:hypothetical protein [Ottowia thiooxydans]